MAILTELQNEDAAPAALYDVFLSFRGIDTRLGFTDHLYQALLSENISTFLDEEEVETGECLKPELERAIRNSRASIIVLSENYASSAWCLEELVTILDQRKNSNHIVLPIFFHVEPTHVRKQQNSFGHALAEHKERMEAEKDEVKKSQRALKLELWTKALTEVADLKGKDAKSRRETEFIEEIVKEISSRLKLHLRTNIPHLIGKGYSIDTISSWLKEEYETCDILTIWGMAGIGKTSLARYIYRLHSQEFERSSFVEDIERRCAQESNALLGLQKQLLRDIQKRSKIEERDSDVYTAMTMKAMYSKRTLVVLDGVDNFEQLDVLIGTKHFNSRSKIIVTTKDGSLTEKCALFHQVNPPKHKKHALSCLSRSESLRLLCWHAFGCYGLKDDCEEQAKTVAMYCSGHPLALKVLGSSLRNADVATWSDTCVMLERKEFPSDIQKVLRVSFDSLPSENCKELFKHIACFFVGKERGETETILKECGICASSGITMLIERSLLTISGINLLMMHQLLQDMGRDIVYQESPKKPWKRSRLWNHEECLKLLKEEKGTCKIQGVVLDMRKEKDWLHESSNVGELKFQKDMNLNFRVIPLVHKAFEFVSMIWWTFTWVFGIYSSTLHGKTELMRTDALTKLDKLHLLQLNYVKLKGSYKNFPTGLRWLCMHGFQLEYIPSDLPMENLVALDLSHSNLKQLWKKPKALQSLKILNLGYTKIVRVEGFLELPALERLILTGCGSLIHVCESIGGCDELFLLDISYCKMLKKLPSSIRKLKKVIVLSLNGCHVGEFPIVLDAFSSSVTELVPRNPKSLVLLLPRSLVSLSLADNNLFNETFPLDFSGLSMLKILNLSGNPIDSLPDCVRSLKRLMVLYVGGCSKLKSVLCLPSSIKILDAEKCSSLLEITFHPEMSMPPFVYYKESKSLIEVEGIMKIQALSQVHEDVLSRLGWSDLKYVKNQDLQIKDSIWWHKVKELPAQMYFEFGIFSTCFPGKEVPNWLAHKSSGSSISLTMTSSPVNKRIQGLNVCFLLTFTGRGPMSFPRTKVRNMTKNQTWIYYSMFDVREADEDIVWLCHWTFLNNEIEVGDDVSVMIEEEWEWEGVKVRECAVNPVYDDGDKEENPLGDYRPWKQIIGGDLSAFQSEWERPLGYHSLIHDQLFKNLHPLKKLSQHVDIQRLLGYSPRYEESGR